VVPAATSAPLAESTSAALVATVEPGAPARAYTTTAKGFWVQLAALGRQDGVDRLQQRVLAQLQALAPLMAVFHESALFKLQVGPYGSREQAQAAAHQAREALQLTPMVIERR
jgi:rare lipoprotein A